MSDLDSGPGTTTVLPPAPPAAPPATGVGAPPPPGGKRRIPVWVIVAVALAAAALAGTAVYLASAGSARQSASRIAELEQAKAALEKSTAELASQTAAATSPPPPSTTTTTGATPPGGTTTPTVPPKPPKVVTVKQLAIVKKVTWSSSKGYQLVADYVQLLTGKAAADAAAAAGQESPPPNDYFILNSSPKLRTLAVPKSCPVIVLGWGGTDATKPTTVPLGQFMDIMPGGVNPQQQWIDGYYWLTVKNGTSITRIQQLYVP